MPNMLLWGATWTSRGTVATTELNSQANATWATGTVYDNTTTLDQYGCFEVYLGSLNPGVNAYVILAIVQAPGATNYEDGPVVTTNPGFHMVVATLSVLDSTAAHRMSTPPVLLPPGLFKVALYNATGVALAATTNTITLYTANPEIQ